MTKRLRRLVWGVLGAALSWAAFCPTTQAMEATLGGALPLLFPADNWWNADISQWPLDPNSAKYIAFINNGGTRRLHPDLGGQAPSDESPNGSYGIPYVTVTGVTAANYVPVEFYYDSQSDGVDRSTGKSLPFYPIPSAAATQPYLVEGGEPGTVDLRDSQDRHLLIVDTDRKFLYELYNVFYDAAQSKWYAGSGAFFDLNTNARRPETWTSADAAGLAILPGLVRYDEVYSSTSSEIGHAFRMTVRATDGYVYPASHRAGSRSGALPMGARLRLKASVDVTQRTKDPGMRRVFRAMQRHGLIVADNGSDMYITGTYDPRWDNDVANPAFGALTANDFEVVQLGYKPSGTSTSGNGVAGLRVRRQANSLLMTWEASVGVARYQVQWTDRLNAGLAWRSAGETAELAWSIPIGAEVATRFYRVVSSAP